MHFEHSENFKIDKIENDITENKEVTNGKSSSNHVTIFNMRLGDIKHYEYILLVLLAITSIFLGMAIRVFTKALAMKDDLVSYIEGVSGSYTDLDELIRTLAEIKYLNEKYSIMDLDYDKAVDLSLKMYTAALGDKYATYMPPVEYTEYMDNRKEEPKVGICVEVIIEETGLYVSDVIEGSQAYKSGILKGDYIIKVGDKKYNYSDSLEFMDLIRGEVGTDTVLTIIRDGDEIELVVTRSTYEAKSIEYRVIDGVGYVRIKQFGYKTDIEFSEALIDLNAQGITKFIFDLRNNTGGLLETVVDMIDRVVPEGTIIRIVGTTDANTTYRSGPSELVGDIVVLVNGATASAAELFTANLKDFEKATIIGTRTFGKGTVVSEYPLSNGGTLVISTAKYYTHSGDYLEEKGITPDIEVKLPDGVNFYKLDDNTDNQLREAIQYLNSI